MIKNNEAIEAAKVLKQFCNENNNMSESSCGCNKCPFMQKEYCLFIGCQIPSDFDIKSNKVEPKEREEFSYYIEQA